MLRRPATTKRVQSSVVLVSAEREQHEATRVDGCRLLMTPWKDRDFPSLSLAFLREGFFLSVGL